MAAETQDGWRAADAFKQFWQPAWSKAAHSINFLVQLQRAPSNSQSHKVCAHARCHQIRSGLQMPIVLPVLLRMVDPRGASNGRESHALARMQVVSHIEGVPGYTSPKGVAESSLLITPQSWSVYGGPWALLLCPLKPTVQGCQARRCDAACCCTGGLFVACERACREGRHISRFVTKQVYARVVADSALMQSRHSTPGQDCHSRPVNFWGRVCIVHLRGASFRLSRVRATSGRVMHHLAPCSPCLEARRSASQCLKSALHCRAASWAAAAVEKSMRAPRVVWGRSFE